MKILLDLFCAWFKMGLFTFGGGYAMLPMIQREVIDKHHWATEEEVMDYYAIGQCTPGIIAVNTATFVGYYQKGVLGAIAATLGIVSPSIVVIVLIASVLTNFQEIAVIQHALSGVRIAVCFLMIQSLVKLCKSNIKNKTAWIIFITAFVLTYFTSISMVLLVILSGITGIIVSLIRGELYE